MQENPGPATSAVSPRSGPLRWKRVMLKLSGEAFAGGEPLGIDPGVVGHLADSIAEAVRGGVQVSVVVGGGNMFRGATLSESGMDRARADYMGMLGTVMNALVLMDALERSGVYTRVQSAIEMRTIAEPYIRRRAIRHLEKGRVVIFGAGTGNPFFSTDTAAALRATELDAEIVIKATKVDGVYDSDPKKNHAAKKFKDLTYIEVLNRRLEVMDSTAITHCMENKMPILVLNLWDNQSLLQAVRGEPTGTLVHG